MRAAPSSRSIVVGAREGRRGPSSPVRSAFGDGCLGGLSRRRSIYSQSTASCCYYTSPQDAPFALSPAHHFPSDLFLPPHRSLKLLWDCSGRGDVGPNAAAPRSQSSRRETARSGRARCPRCELVRCHVDVNSYSGGSGISPIRDRYLSVPRCRLVAISR